ncbi:MAG: DUF421 domain-containing protein [Mucilaginibacter sp.]
MELMLTIFGEGKDLNALQMSNRGIVMFIIALILLRISGRRSFGLRTPLDNIIVILLGAVMSRAVVGASPFIPVIISCLAITLLHRLFGALIANSKWFGRFVEGEKIPLFEDGQFRRDKMKRVQLCKEDIMQGVRKSALTEDMNDIEKIYIERNGEISSIKKKR